MLHPDLTEEDVQAAIADLDGETSRLAADAWMALTAGEGPSMVSLAGLQNWAWWLLPKRSHSIEDHDYWVAVVEGAAALFDRLGAESYAQLCRSETTAKVLGAWATSRSKGRAATLRALAKSPVEPPDLDDFAWGTMFGVWENEARTAVELALETAIVEGRLDPTARNWRKTAAAICADTLDTPHPSQVDQSWRTLLLTERAQHWATGPLAPQQQRQARQAIANRFMSPPAPPDFADISTPIGLLAWFTDACADGATLTTSGYLPRAMVLDAVDRYRWWWDWDKPPQSEADVWQLQLVHRAAKALGLVRRRGRTLKSTRAGTTVATDPLAWWPRLALLGQGDEGYRDALFENVALVIIDGDVHEVEDVRHHVGAELAQQNWRTDRKPMTAEDHGRHLYRALNPWRVWGFIDYQPTRSEPTPQGERKIRKSTATATPAGQNAAALWLHHRITGPRSGM